MVGSAFSDIKQSCFRNCLCTSAPRGGARFGSRGRTHAAASAGSRGGKASYCKHCRTSTHNTWDCYARQAAEAKEKAAFDKPEVHFSAAAYDTAYALTASDVDTALHTSSSPHDADTALHLTTDTDCLMDKSDALANIGNPTAFDAMPNPTLINPVVGTNNRGHVNALRPKGLTMVFHGLIAVNGLHVRVLVDPGASHSYIREDYLETELKKADVAIKHQSSSLSLANGTQAVSKSVCVLPLDIQTYQSAVECYTLPIADQFDMILEEDWIDMVDGVISYKDYHLECTDFESCTHKLLTQTRTCSVLL